MGTGLCPKEKGRPAPKVVGMPMGVHHSPQLIPSCYI